jgi:hypothetical protein
MLSWDGNLAMTKNPFPIFDFIYLDLVLIAFCTWLVHGGTSPSTAFFIGLLSFTVCLGALIVRWQFFASRTQPQSNDRIPWRKVLMGNAVALAATLQFYLQGVGMGGVEFVAALLFVGGNTVFFVEWLWQRYSFNRSKPPTIH